VAKQELTQKFHSRVFLQRLGTLFVERFDSLRGAASASEFAAQLRAGRSLVFFPEGTFRTEPGLLPFYMGAFVAAVRSGVPIVPATIRGTREILRADSDFPHHGAVQVIIESPMEPQGEDWAEALRLRTAARAVIASQCDEQYP
jgi:1-acyl-sn-glycerol-3-phosphate acyltransferase